VSTLAGELYTAIQGDAWDDLVMPVTAIPLQGQSGDPDIDTEGIFLFDDTTAEQVSILYQMPHSWNHTGVRFHCHWSKSTDAAGDVTWEMRHRIFNNGDVPGAWGSWVAATIRSVAVDATQKVIIDGWAEIDMSAIRLSGWVHLQLRRNPGAAADTYAADARLYGADVHFRRFGLGSAEEYPT
jgi:hypothetical protein